MREVVTAAALDEGATTVILGDSTGHLRVLDISGGIDVSSGEAAVACFKQVGVHWAVTYATCKPHSVSHRLCC